MSAGLAEVSELKAIELDVRKAVDNDVKRVGHMDGSEILVQNKSWPASYSEGCRGGGGAR